MICFTSLHHHHLVHRCSWSISSQMCQFILAPIHFWNSIFPTQVFRLGICTYSMRLISRVTSCFKSLFIFLSELNLTSFRRLSSVSLYFLSRFSGFTIHWILLTSLPISPITDCVSELNLSLFLRRLHSLPHRVCAALRGKQQLSLSYKLCLLHLYTYEYEYEYIRIRTMYETTFVLVHNLDLKHNIIHTLQIRHCDNHETTYSKLNSLCAILTIQTICTGHCTEKILHWTLLHCSALGGFSSPPPPHKSSRE